jgi:hypothetical protein
LDDHVIDSVDVELEFGAGVGVAETELRFLDIVCLEAFEEFGGMEANTADEFLSILRCDAGYAEFFPDGCTEVRVRDGKENFGLFGRLGEVELEEVFKIIIQDT